MANSKITIKDVANAAVTVGKHVVSTLTTIAVAEGGFVCGKIMENDIEAVVKVVDAKINPITMKKPHWYSLKPQPFNERTKTWVTDKKAK